MKITVFGGSGFLGSHVSDALTSAGHDVTIFDKVVSPFLLPGQRMITGDILDAGRVREAVAGADAVYHFAGIADIDEAIHRPVDTIKYNVLGTAMMLEACIEMAVKRVIFASTVYVYSAAGSFYRVSKQSSELLIEAFHEKHNLEYTILRYGSLYGPRADHRNGIYRFLFSAVNDGVIRYRGDGEEVREYIHILDAARMSVDVLAPEWANQHITLTGQQVLKAKDLLSMIREILNNSVEIEMLPKTSGIHYRITPYNFAPKLGRKMVSNAYVDMGQGILEMVGEIYRAKQNGYEEQMGFLVRKDGQ